MKLIQPLLKTYLCLIALVAGLFSLLPLQAQIFVDTSGSALTGENSAYAQSTNVLPSPPGTATSPPAYAAWPGYYGGTYSYSGGVAAPANTGISNSVAATSSSYGMNYSPTSLTVNADLDAKMGFNSTGASQEFANFNTNASLTFSLSSLSTISLNGLAHVVVNTAGAAYGGGVVLMDDTTGAIVAEFDLTAAPTVIAYSGTLGPDTYTLDVSNVAKANPLLGPLLGLPSSEIYGADVSVSMDIESAPEPSETALMILGSVLLLVWKIRGRRLR